MTPEVGEMVSVRHSAEQRGNFEPLGRLLFLRTDHGTIQFPAENGECVGPDLAAFVGFDGDSNLPNSSGPPLIVLGRWSGLPALRRLTDQPCPKCRHACDLCVDGKKQCEGYLCGGRGWVPGVFQLCGAAGCSKETGTPKGGCTACGGAGQVAEQKECLMCHGVKGPNGLTVMTCPRCKGSGKFSTGKINGSIDWTLAACKSCNGLCFRSEMVPQDVRRFVNATLVVPRTSKSSAKGYLVVGPIREFALMDFQSSRTRVFDVSPDAQNDLLVLLVPRSPLQKPQKAYLVGGIVRERQVLAAVGA